MGLELIILIWHWGLHSLSPIHMQLVSIEVTVDFFGKLGSVYALLNILSKAMQIFNMD